MPVKSSWHGPITGKTCNPYLQLSSPEDSRRSSTPPPASSPSSRSPRRSAGWRTRSARSCRSPSRRLRGRLRRSGACARLRGRPVRRADARGAASPFDRSIAGGVVQSGEMADVTVEDPRLSDYTIPDTLVHEKEAIVIVPLVVGADVIGTLSVPREGSGAPASPSRRPSSSGGSQPWRRRLRTRTSASGLTEPSPTSSPACRTGATSSSTGTPSSHARRARAC